MSKQVILTGIRANNDLTLGNYFGAILPMIDMAKNRSDEYQINLFIPDLHSITTPIDYTKLQSQITQNLRVFVAAGLPLDKQDIYVYRQSYIPANSEMTWIFDCFTGFGEMNRMTQFGEKSGTKKSLAEVAEEIRLLIERGVNLPPLGVIEKIKGILTNFSRSTSDNTTLGLFNYPVLMASDILLYGATYVPVGDDQTQHLEFTRDIAERMNRKFSQELFVIPEPVKKQHEFFGNDQGLRIMDLADPTKKMSKSDDTGRGVIFLSDNPDEAYEKVMKATTDSEGQIHFRWETQPGITNLLQIFALLKGKDQKEVNEEWEGKSSYGDLKSAVAEAIKSFLEGLQSSLAQVDDNGIKAKLKSSEEAMNKVANAILLKVQKAVGLR